MNDLCHEGHSFSRDSGGSGHGFGEGLAYGPRVESGAIPVHGLVAGHPQQYAEGDRFGPTERINSSCDTGYSNIGHNHVLASQHV